MVQFRKDVSALLISGNEERHFNELKKFADYLIATAGVHPSCVEYLSGRMDQNRNIMEHVDDFVHRARERRANEPFVIAYHGHGLPSGFCPDGSPTSYQDLVDAVGFDVPFVFINSCCYAGKAVEVFRDCRLLTRWGSVIAGSRSYELSYGTLFLDALLKSYEQKQPFRRKKISELRLAEIPQFPEDMSERTRFYTQHPTRLGICLDSLLYAQS